MTTSIVQACMCLGLHSDHECSRLAEHPGSDSPVTTLHPRRSVYLRKQKNSATWGVRQVTPRGAPLLCRLPRLDALHPGGAIFELRNLPERIERRIGEQVGG